jgi:Acyl-CoA thioesterase C-terminal domain/Acyl-CoA thioesterase N-terminal domain
VNSTAAFYEPDGDGFASSALTRGPWDGDSQHAGPPAALVGRAVLRCEGIGTSPEQRFVGRITFEILRPVPIGRLAVSTGVVRPGRRVDMVEAVLRDEDGEALIAARAWRLLRGEVELPAGLGGADPGSPAQRAGRPTGDAGAPTPPGELEADAEFFPTGYDVGYHTAMDYRFTEGAFIERGPATVWMRMGLPLIPGEEPTPLQRVLAAADSGNGVSAALDWSKFLFINVDLTVHLHRMPEGEWVCLDAVTLPEQNGIGMADTRLLDERGAIGRAVQTLLIAER